MALYLRYAVRSDLGLVRGNNEDAVYAGPRLLAIADGMGGHAAGEVASQIAVGALQPLDDDRSIDDLMADLREAVASGNQQIAAAAGRDPALEGMGTTLTALRFAAGQVGLVHVGDSRAYLLRGDQLSQITHDDTYVQFLVDTGELTPDEAKDHPRKSVILRALTGADVEPDVSIREARAGDRYLLCTDGLTDVVTPETIGETMRIDDLQECADRLVELALRGGGPDNVTVIVADVINARVGDMIDDVPVVAGAFVDPKAADVPGDDSPAERAARMTRAAAAPAKSEPPAEPPRKSRRGLRWALILIGIFVVLVGGLGGTYAWAQTQYFVGRDGSEVAIFRGVNAEFGPLKFFKVYKNTNLTIDDLYPTYRSQVKSGINARSVNDAQSIVATLNEQVMPVCTTAPPPSPTSSSSAASSSTSSSGPLSGSASNSASNPASNPASDAAPSGARSGSVSRSSGASSPIGNGSASAGSSSRTGAVTSANASRSGSTSGSNSGPSGSDSSGSGAGSSSPLSTPEPNVDCRPS